MRAGWAFPPDWWTPAVEAVAEALYEGRNAAEACTRLGRARADAAVGLEEALADLASLHATWTGTDALLGPSGAATASDAPGDLVAAVALGWADVSCDPAVTGGCEDPLTGLSTPAYLHARLAEIYREAECGGEPAAASHAFVVVALGDPGAGLVQLSRGIQLGECVRAAFPGGETICAVGPARVVALAGRDGRLASRVVLLRRLLADELDPTAARSARVWVEGLPLTLHTARRLLAELVR